MIARQMMKIYPQALAWHMGPGDKKCLTPMRHDANMGQFIDGSGSFGDGGYGACERAAVS